mgnify:CR=1 FL=1
MPKGLNDQLTYSRDIGFDMKVSYDSANREEYRGYAYPGAAASEAKWQIYKLSYDDTTGLLLTKRYAGSVDDFTNIWNNRSSLNYVDI